MREAVIWAKNKTEAENSLNFDAEFIFFCGSFVADFFFCAQSRFLVNISLLLQLVLFLFLWVIQHQMGSINKCGRFIYKDRHQLWPPCRVQKTKISQSHKSFQSDFTQFLFYYFLSLFHW